MQLDTLDKKDAKTAKKFFLEVFWNDVGQRLRALGVSDVRALKKGYRDLVDQFYGLHQAYTKGLELGDSDLSSALLR